MTDFPGSNIASPGVTIGPGGAAPADALYLVLATDPLLSNERVFTAGTGLTSIDGGAGGAFTVTADLSTGVSGGQAAIGGTDAGDDLTLRATSNATPGDIIFEVTPGAEVARFLSTEEFLVGVSAVLFGSDIASFSNNQNASTSIGLSNTTVGTAARSTLILQSNVGTLLLITTSSAFTPVTGFEASAGHLQVSGGLDLLIICDLGAGEIKFKTNRVDAARFLSTQQFLVGLTSGGTGIVRIEQSSLTAAEPCLQLEQVDVSEEFVRYIGTAAAGVLTQSIVDEGDVTTATRQGFIKVFVQDDGNQITDQAYFMPLFTLA